MTRGTARQAFAGLYAACAWTALIVQLQLMLGTFAAKGGSVAETLVSYFSYFTILTNLMAAVWMTGVAFGKTGSNFASALATYLVVVGITYNTLLRDLWNPQGWQKAVDIFLHSLSPPLFLLYWIFFVPRGQLRWNAPLFWLLYPLLYLIWCVARGLYTNLYPYPFIDVAAIGIGRAAVNAAGVTLLLLAAGYSLVGLDRWLKTKK